MICSIINEGTAPRHALGGSLPTSKPVAPNTSQSYPKSARPVRSSRELLSLSDCESPSSAAHDPGFVALPIAVFIVRTLVVLFLSLGETNGQFRAAVFPIQL